MLGTDLVLFLALQARLASLSVAMLTCCLLVGMVASLVEVFRGCSSVDCVVRGFLPVACAWFSGLSGLLGSCFGAFCLVQVQAVAALAGLLFCSSCACLVSSGTAASRMLTVVLALGGCVDVRLWVFFLLGFHLAACFPDGWLVRRLGSLPPIFSLTFSFGVVIAPWFLVGVLQRFFPPGGSSCSLLRLACLRSGGGKLGWQSLAGPYVLRDVYLVPVRFSPLLILRYTGSFRRPRCACLWISGLSASACSHACGRFREIALGPGAGFPFVSLPGGRVV